MGDALRFAAPGVDHLRIRAEGSAVNPEVRHFADERVCGGLEHQRGDLPAAVARQLAPILGAGRADFRRRHFRRGGQIVGDEIHQLAHARLVQRRAGENGDERAFHDSAFDAGYHLVRRYFLAFQILGGEVVVHLGDGFHKPLAGFLRGVGEVGRDVRVRIQQADDA